MSRIPAVRSDAAEAQPIEVRASDDGAPGADESAATDETAVSGEAAGADETAAAENAPAVDAATETPADTAGDPANADIVIDVEVGSGILIITEENS